MLLALGFLFVVAIASKTLQLSDLVALLFAMFAACNRQDSSAYKVPIWVQIDTHPSVAVLLVQAYHAGSGPIQQSGRSAIANN